MSNQRQIDKICSYVYNIATDVLVYSFERGDYKKIILPFMVLRRIDVMLESTKEQVLEKKKFCDEHGLTDYEPFMYSITKCPFYNTSAFTMKTLKNEIDPQRLKMNVIEYFNGFSEDVKDVIDKFKLRQWVDNLTEQGVLGAILDKFTTDSINFSIKPVLDDDGNEIMPGLDNHAMGTIFENLLRRFNEENNVTEAGEHFTPRDYVQLLATLAIEPIIDQIENSAYSIYDGACGTGGILTIAQETIERLAQERGKRVNISIFGQESQADTYATCKADLMMSGHIKNFTYRLNGDDHQYISFGSTLSQDGHFGETFDFCISNPPFGTPWKKDLEAWGLGEKEKNKVTDTRFYDGATSFIPDIGDCQMMFLANNIAKMKEGKLGTRIVEVHNGSSLFTGDAGKGASNLRKYIMENDLLECIIQMPEKDFYNTGIATYIWVLSNRKEEKRKGLVQLIDASTFIHPLPKNLGEKNCETGEEERKKIMDLYYAFEENEYSRIFPTTEFGYWEVPVCDEVIGKLGIKVLKNRKNESEQVPLSYAGGIDAYWANEVTPYDSDAKAGEAVVGYELSFTKYFYKPVELRSLEEIDTDLKSLEANIDGLFDQIMKG